MELEQERDEVSSRCLWMEELLQQSTIPTCLWHGPDLVYTFANRIYLERSGKTDVVGKPIREVFAEREVPGLIPILEQAYTSGEPQVVPEALIRLEHAQTGEIEESWHNLLYNPVRDAQGNVIGVSNFAVEVTEQVKARQELHRQAQILNQVRGSIVVTDMEGSIISWNQESTRIFGYTAEEAIGQPVSIIYPPEEHERLLNKVIIPLHREGTLETETLAWNKQGNRFPLQLSLSLLRDDHDTPIGMIGYSVDITERKQQEEELSIFKAMAENSPDAIGIADPDGVITYANQSFRAMFGYGDATIGMLNVSLFTEEDQRERIPRLFAELQAKGFWSGLLTGQRKDGSTFPAHLSPFAICDSNGNLIAVPAIVRDISEEKRAEAERAALQEQVIEAQRASLRELSAPLLPIAAGVVILPLIGTIDSGRAQQIMETLLEGVANHHANTAIIDITGVQVVDTQVANALIHAAQAVRLLGAEVILTGIGPAMAQTLVHLGVELVGLVTRSNLQAGIAHAWRISRGKSNGAAVGAKVNAVG
jgi:rsbT co-antagonist protein RsbR